MMMNKMETKEIHAICDRLVFIIDAGATPIMSPDFLLKISEPNYLVITFEEAQKMGKFLPHNNLADAINSRTGQMVDFKTIKLIKLPDVKAEFDFLPNEPPQPWKRKGKNGYKNR